MITCDDLLNKAKAIHSSFSSKDYSHPCAEVEFRECARTAYYYIFHKANTRALTIPGSFNKNTGSHQRVIDKLMTSTDKKDHDLAKLLVKVRTVRVKADYGLNEHFQQIEAYKILREAEKLISKGF